MKLRLVVKLFFFKTNIFIILFILWKAGLHKAMSNDHFC